MMEKNKIKSVSFIFGNWPTYFLYRLHIHYHSYIIEVSLRQNHMTLNDECMKLVQWMRAYATEKQTPPPNIWRYFYWRSIIYY